MFCLQSFDLALFNFCFQFFKDNIHSYCFIPNVHQRLICLLHLFLQLLLPLFNRIIIQLSHTLVQSIHTALKFHQLLSNRFHLFFDISISTVAITACSLILVPYFTRSSLISASFIYNFNDKFIIEQQLNIIQCKLQQQCQFWQNYFVYQQSFTLIQEAITGLFIRHAQISLSLLIHLNCGQHLFEYCIQQMILIVYSIYRFYNIKSMGNCFGSSQKQKKGSRLEISPNTKQILEMQNLKLQSYLNIDNQDLKIDAYDINTTAHPAFLQIAKDIERTYPKQQYFKVSGNKIGFERLLKRIALHYPKLGYTQGINFVAGYFMLEGLGEIQAYKSFVSMLVDPDLMFFGLYEDLFPLARLYCELFWKLLRIKCKSFAERIEAISLPDQMWIFQWFICFFIYNFPIQYISKIFRFILKGKKFAMVRLAVAIMMHLQVRFKKVTDQFEQEFVQCMEALKQYTFCNDQLPLKAILSLAEAIKPQQIENLLSKCSENWYQNYFTLSSETRSDAYHKFINQKDRDRLEFFGKIKSGISIVTYERHPDSVVVIDNIQERKVQRYMILYQSLGERPHGSFVKFSKRYSLNEEKFNQLVESVIYN